jgi:hypothetical protein
MASSVGRYIIVSPATSQLLREILDDAIDNGSRTINITAAHEDGAKIDAIFTLTQARYRDMHAEYLGELHDNGVATIVAMTHPDLGDTPARLTLVRRDTP